MHIAIIHYHLNRGGVMQVIANHLRSLDAALRDGQRWQVAVLYGGRDEGWPEQLAEQLEHVQLERYVVRELEYDSDAVARPRELAAALRGQLQQIGFAPDRAVLHVHNHALGKNVSLPGALAELARDGYPMLLQVHDFAEDLRPEVYRGLATSLSDSGPLPTLLYPQADHVHYAVLNRRDQRVLETVGVSDQRIHFLPNPAAPFGELPPRDEVRERMAAELDLPKDRSLVLYPVRCIRRKNIGEAILWSALMGSDATFGFTLAPMNPVEQPSYENWKRLVTELNLNCQFEMGEAFSFHENLAAADALLTTSVAEGFGMVFLEAWLAGRPLVGRNLPAITADFCEHGLALDWTYERLAVPVDWIGKDVLAAHVMQVYAATLAAYGRPAPDQQQVTRQLDTLTADGNVDFGRLDVQLQQQVIRRVADSVESRERLRGCNVAAARALALRELSAMDTIERNRRVVTDNYAPAVCGRRLCEIYQDVVASDRIDHLEGPPAGEQILEFFLALERFRPLRAQA